MLNKIVVDMEEFHGGAPWRAHKQKKVAGDSSELRESFQNLSNFAGVVFFVHAYLVEIEDWIQMIGQNS